MKSNFFYDEDDRKPYESIQDWVNEIKHLIAPTLVMAILGIAMYLFYQFFVF